MSTDKKLFKLPTTFLESDFKKYREDKQTEEEIENGMKDWESFERWSMEQEEIYMHNLENI